MSDPLFCARCGTYNYKNATKCRGCGGKLFRQLPEPKIITDTGTRFGL